MAKNQSIMQKAQEKVLVLKAQGNCLHTAFKAQENDLQLSFSCHVTQSSLHLLPNLYYCLDLSLWIMLLLSDFFKILLGNVWNISLAVMNKPVFTSLMKHRIWTMQQLFYLVVPGDIGEYTVLYYSSVLNQQVVWF